MRPRNAVRLALLAIALLLGTATYFLMEDVGRLAEVGVPPALVARESAKSSDRAGSDRGSGVATRAESSAGEPAPPAAAVILQVLAPRDVRAGQVLTAEILLDARGGLRQVHFSLGFDQSRLALVAWSEGDFGDRSGAPALLTTDEPSDGNLEVTYAVSNQLVAAGTGTLAKFEFQALRPGTSEIRLQNPSVIARRGTLERSVTVASVPVVTIH